MSEQIGCAVGIVVNEKTGVCKVILYDHSSASETIMDYRQARLIAKQLNTAADNAATAEAMMMAVPINNGVKHSEQR